MALHTTLPLTTVSSYSRRPESRSISPLCVFRGDGSSPWLPPPANIAQGGYRPRCDIEPFQMQDRSAGVAFADRTAYADAPSPPRVNFQSNMSPFTRRPLQQTTQSPFYTQIPLTATAVAGFASISSRTEYPMGGDYFYVSHPDDSEGRSSWQNHNILPEPTLLDEHPSYEVSDILGLADPTVGSSQYINSPQQHQLHTVPNHLHFNYTDSFSETIASPVPSFPPPMHGFFNTDAQNIASSSYSGQVEQMSGPLGLSPNTNGDSPSPSAMILGRRGSTGSCGSPNKSSNLACFFCRGRKIACGKPIEGSADMTCNQCARRRFKCEYPAESRRGQHKRSPRKRAPNLGHEVNFAM